MVAATYYAAGIRTVVEDCWSGSAYGVGSVSDPWAPLTWRNSRRLGRKPEEVSRDFSILYGTVQVAVLL